MEAMHGWLHTNRLMLIGLACLIIGLIQLCFHWRGKSLDTILSEDPQNAALRLRKRREGASFGLALAGLFLIVYFAFTR
jgi:hypothetical protein